MENIIKFRQNPPTPTGTELTFKSAKMKTLIQTAVRYARSSASVLITGESGTGKEVFSRLIHNQSQRATAKYVAVNCAAMPEMLIESEFFGHERGAFTGAFHQRTGHFQNAHGGTLVLDEISEIPVTIQAKLLRVIEEQEVQRIGGNSPESIDVRIVATSNRELEQEIQNGTFRLDLYHRLNVLTIEIPPLRQRSDDIEPLAKHFLGMFRHESSQPIHGLTATAIEKLVNYRWPGNVRELKNVIHRACIECRSHQISAECLPDLIDALRSPETHGRQLADVEKEMILASLKKNRGNKTRAAAELGVTSRTLSNKLKLYEQQKAA